jgi:hypothetical protein
VASCPPSKQTVLPCGEAEGEDPSYSAHYFSAWGPQHYSTHATATGMPPSTLPDNVAKPFTHTTIVVFSCLRPPFPRKEMRHPRLWTSH